MADPTNPDDTRAWAEALAELDPSERQVAGRLLALLFGSTPPTVPVVRAERFEVVDRRGHTRVAIGQMGDAEDGAFGVAMYDRSGSERAALAVGEAGVWLSFAFEGNDALVLGVDDADSSNLFPGPHLQLLRANGGVAVGWWVDAGTGTVRAEVDYT